MGLRLITPPTVEPVLLADAKAHLRIDHTDDDVRLARQIKEAREWVEKRIQSKVATATWEFVFDAFPASEIRLPFGPALSITHIKYDDEAGDEQTISAEDYWLDDASVEPWVFPEVSWPATLSAANAVRVRFVAGYAAANLIPMPIVAAIYSKLQELYDGEDTSEAVHRLLTNYYQFTA